MDGDRGEPVLSVEVEQFDAIDWHAERHGVPFHGRGGDVISGWPAPP
jgi:hypothetical protein